VVLAKRLLDGLSAHDATFGYIAMLVAFGFGSAIS
jgi:hypothetical protein